MSERFFKESGVAAEIADMIEPILDDLGYLLVLVQLVQDSGSVVRVLAEKQDGTMSIDDCSIISRELSPMFDVEDPMHDPYRLEVSSPGVDRPLVRIIDFDRFSGSKAKIELINLDNGRRRFKGHLAGVIDKDAGKIGIRVKKDDGTDELFSLSINNLAMAKLVF